jgi:hypothetical protein
VNVIPVRIHIIGTAVRTTRLEEVGHPDETVRGRGSARSSESVTLGCQRLDITVPSGDSIGDRGISLRWFVDFVHTECELSITGLGVLDESVDTVLVKTPEHDADGKTRVLHRVRDGGGPKMEHYDIRGSYEERYPRVVTKSPSDGEFSPARRGRGGCVGWACAGGAGARCGRRWRGRVVTPLGRWVGRQRSGRARGRGARGRIARERRARGRVAGSRPGLAGIALLLLLGNSVVVGELPSQVVVRLDGEGKGLGGSERTEEDSE